MRSAAAGFQDPIIVRAPDWLGDAVMALPALVAIRADAPRVHLVVLARPSVAAIYRAPLVDRVLIDSSATDWKDAIGRGRGLATAPRTIPGRRAAAERVRRRTGRLAGGSAGTGWL